MHTALGAAAAPVETVGKTRGILTPAEAKPEAPVGGAYGADAVISAIRSNNMSAAGSAWNAMESKVQSALTFSEKMKAATEWATGKPFTEKPIVAAENYFKAHADAGIRQTLQKADRSQMPEHMQKAVRQILGQ
jgi:hypothetical protein